MPHLSQEVKNQTKGTGRIKYINKAKSAALAAIPAATMSSTHVISTRMILLDSSWTSGWGGLRWLMRFTAGAESTGRTRRGPTQGSASPAHRAAGRAAPDPAAASPPAAGR